MLFYGISLIMKEKSNASALIGDGLANCFIIGSTIILKMYCYSIKGKPYSLYGVEQSGMKARRVLLQNRSIEIYSWL